MATISKLSEDMVAEILSRLPPKSLMRFKCVHKSWCSLIKNPNFVDKFLSNSKKNKLASSSSIVVKHNVPKDTNIKYDEEDIQGIADAYAPVETNCILSLLNIHHDIIIDRDVLDAATVVEVENLCENLTVLHDPMTKCPYGLEIIGHCDGIICLKLRTYPEDSIVLYNPAIKEFKLLPRSSLVPSRGSGPPPDNDDEYVVDTWMHPMGFGYGLGLKVVRIVEFFRALEETAEVTRRKAEVYTLGADSWRVLECDIKAHVFWQASFEMHFNGIFYWYASSDPQDEEVILSFDMSEEVFHNIPLPDNSHGWRKSLAVWNDSVALFLYKSKDENTRVYSFEIWAMDDSSEVKGSWIKHFTIGTLPDIEIPLVFWKSDELLMVTSHGSARVVSYNLGTKTLKYLPIRDASNPNFVRGFVYVSSILSVKGDNKREALSRETPARLTP